MVGRVFVLLAERETVNNVGTNIRKPTVDYTAEVCPVPSSIFRLHFKPKIKTNNQGRFDTTHSDQTQSTITFNTVWFPISLFLSNPNTEVPISNYKC
jgi:hypothetical protein